MRIQSSFRDYYDGCAAGVDPADLIFVRETRVLKPSQLQSDVSLPCTMILQPHHFSSPCFSVEPKLIGFCGAVVPVLAIGPWPDPAHPRAELIKVNGKLDLVERPLLPIHGSSWRYFSDPESFRVHALTLLAQAPFESPMWDVTSSANSGNAWRLAEFIQVEGDSRKGFSIDLELLAGFFKPELWEKTATNVFCELKAPIFRIGPDFVEVNGSLERFFRLFDSLDAYTACTKIAAYLS